MAHGTTRHWYGICIILLLFGCDNEIEEKIKTEYITSAETVYVDHDYINIPIEEGQNTITLTQDEIDKINNGEVLYMRVLPPIFSQGQNWVKADTPSFGVDSNRVTRICFGNGMFVATGLYGKIAYSSDANTWVQASTTNFGGSEHVRSVTYINGEFIAVGDTGKVAFSTDGDTWTLSDPGLDWGDVIVHDIVARTIGVTTTYIVSGAGGRMAFSTDGDNWTNITMHSLGSTHITALCSGDKYVAAAYEGIEYSMDAVSWTPASGTILSESYWGLAYGNGIYVAVGTNGVILYSSDGMTWSQASTPSFDETHILGVAYGNGRFLAVGSSGKMAYSVDGDTWVQVASTPVESGLEDACWGNNIWVAGGYVGEIIYSRW